MTAAAWIVLCFLAMMYSWTQQRAYAQRSVDSMIASQAVQDLKIQDLEKQDVANSERITQLEHDVWIWKGIVLSLGTIISLLELFQALGLIRTGLTTRQESLQGVRHRRGD